MSEDKATPKIHIDSDWKAQAQAEKERLSEKEAARGPGPSVDEGALPPAEFKSLIGLLASQAMMGLGTMGDPKSGRLMVDLEGAQFAIDLLAVMEEKTKGNLTEDEAEDLKLVLSELRGRYVQINQLIAQQIASGAGGAPAAPDLSL